MSKIKRRLHVMISPALDDALRAEAKRLYRSLSWVIALAWSLSRERISLVETQVKDEP